VDKEHILREIKRTAEDNGGKPLGYRKFTTETGIRPHEWQKYWVKWSDALHEAGFRPNRWIRAYDDADLFEGYAQLAKELGHLPVFGELKIRSRTDSTFPSTEPFRRLGAKAELVRRLREHCLNHGGYDDVIRMCGAFTPSNRRVPDDAGSRDPKIGFVYLMKSGRFYKIGHSDAPGRRQYDVAIQLPEKVDLIHKIPTEAPEAAERYWHERFKAKRKGGEWFALNAADVKTFRRCKSM